MAIEKITRIYFFGEKYVDLAIPVYIDTEKTDWHNRYSVANQLNEKIKELLREKKNNDDKIRRRILSQHRKNR